ncbi:histo-blood group ABO system transferase 2-like isoform X2 [Herpailurus yagouaroundi]|uniref:histo-blood group ABO system transferase 2-like isoform X2 n=1 Tax=Herpailurus yagouaroundi TaxID=1608482 RepID=UPI001AD68481|nr:histo-blood group ABO system transferase 2-like isoform X2 [Puma yagouaroundi]
MVYRQPKVLTPSKDVLVLTPWLAPTVWEGTFNIDILNEQFRLRNTTIGLTVFVIKKYVAFLELFLQTAEKHFMVGHKVSYYVFTDRPGDVPRVPLGEGRQVVVLEVRSYSRWQDVSTHRMEMIRNFSRQREVFRGVRGKVLRLTSACHQATVVDRAHGIEAVWHDESHLNRYLLDHKPTKVLSPEYLWDEQLLGWPAVEKKLRYVTVPKSHRGIRD